MTKPNLKCGWPVGENADDGPCDDLPVVVFLVHVLDAPVDVDSERRRGGLALCARHAPTGSYWLGQDT